MTYAHQPTSWPEQPGPRPPRPAGVLVAGCMQFAVVLFALLNSVFITASIGDWKDAAETELESQGIARSDIEDLLDLMSAFNIVVIVATVLLMAVYATFTGLTLIGKNWARIVVWVLNAFVLLCMCTGLLPLGITGDEDVVDNEALQDAVVDAVANEFWAFFVVAAILSLGALITATVLLAIPSANRYFRKTPPPPPAQQMYVPGPPPMA